MTPPPPSDDESLLDRLFDHAVACRARGEPVDLAAVLGERRHLRERAAEVVALAHAVAPSTAPRADRERHAVPGYELFEEIGRGGMGIVYRARQQSLDRIVALKVLAPALMASERARHRFAVEANALAKVTHPNVVTVHDVAIADGLCAYAMEWIDGPTLSRAIERGDARLTIPGLVDLFAALARALAVVHAAGLVHRDVKPGNILLRADGTPVLTDFSLVRAAEHSAHTATGDFVGTAAYAAPEQLRGEHERVDARSDVYSLGVTLYVALTGQVPYGLTTVSETLRRIEAGSILPVVRANPRVPRDLATIVATAMDPDPARRYASAAAFAEDLERLRDHRPILAQPASAALRLRRWARRNPGVAATFAALLLGMTTTSWFAFEASAQARLTREQELLAARRADDNAALAAAETRARAAAQANADRATERAAELEQIARFHDHQWLGADAVTMGSQLRAEVLARANPAVRQQLDEALVGVDFAEATRSLLDQQLFARSLRTIADSFPTDSLVQARLRRGVAQAMAELGIAGARDVAQAAHDVLTAALGPDHPETLTAAHNLATMLVEHDPATAGDALRAVLERRRRVLGDSDPETQRTRANLAAWTAMHAPDDTALAACEQLRAECERVFGADDRRTLEATGRVVAVWIRLQRFGDAEPLARDLVARCRKHLGDHDPETASATCQWGVAQFGHGDPRAAVTTLEAGLAGLRRAFGTGHPQALEAAGQYGLVLAALGRHEEAEACLREVLAGRRRRHGDDAPATWTAENDLALVLRARGDLAAAEPLFRAALEGRRQRLGEDHPDTLVSLNNLASLRHAQKQYAEAVQLYRACLDARRRQGGPDDRDALVVANNLAAALFQQQAHEECAALLQDVVERSRRVFGARHPATLQHQAGLAHVLVTLSRRAEAEPILRDTLAGRREVLGTEHPETLETTQRLGALLRNTDRPAEAVALLTEALDCARRTFGGDRAPQLATWLSTLGKAHTALADPEHLELAEACFVEVHGIRSRRFGAAHRQTQDTIRDLVTLLEARHAAEPDAGHDRRAAEWRARLAPPPG
jgi:tetratricopeptide (TPR) repeat protein